VGKPIRATILGDVLQAYWTHWVLIGEGPDGHTVPCYGEEHCTVDHTTVGALWWGYVAAMRHSDEEPVILMLSLRAAELIERLASRLSVLRGLAVEIGRQGDYETGAMLVSRTDRWSRKALLPAHPIEDSLRRVWRVTTLPQYVPWGVSPQGEGRAS
jgi:hypothetical protein